MERREMLGLLGAGAAGLTVLGGGTARADHEDDDNLEVMAECAHACARAASHCLEQLKKGSGNAEKHANALKHAAACEEFCILSAKQEACGSPLAYLAHEANARACEECARACEGQDAQVMKECVESCRKCAEHCRKMARKGGSR